MSNILEELNLTEEAYTQGEASAVAKEFTAMTSGVYDGTVKEVIVYTNQYDGKQMRYNIEVTVDGEPKNVTFRSDIGKTLKDGSDNKGYAGRLKQFAYATNTELAALSIGKDVTIKSFGKEVKGEFITGMNGKKIKVLVRQSDDTNKADGQPFKITNDVMGVVAMDGTDSEGENAAEKFEEQVKKTPVFAAPRKVKGGGATTASTASTAGGKPVADLLQYKLSMAG